MATPAATRVTPECPIDQQPAIGLIGMGAMGKLYAKTLSAAGWKKIHVCDQPSKYESVKREWERKPGITVHRDGHLVSRISDFILYSVEAEFIDTVVEQYGPSTKVGAIVAGQTSVKAPERAAFEKHLPQDVHIVSCHSLHGPTVSPVDQPLVLINHRGSDEALALVEDILRCFRSRYVYMSYEEHDSVTANTQAVTHAAFLSMGTSWSSAQSYPWEHGSYVGGIETVKVNIMLRIYSNQWHVYAGLAILNPAARHQITQYSTSVTQLFKLMLTGDEQELRRRLYDARERVFGFAAGSEGEGRTSTGSRRAPILLSEKVLDQFSLGKTPHAASVSLPEPHSLPAPPTSASPASSSSPSTGTANSHLSLLAMVDCWSALGIQPYYHLELAATPIFRLWIGVAEYLFRSPSRLDAAIHAAIHDVSHRYDDLEFVVSARGWSQCVNFGNFELYRRRFQEARSFFEPRFEDAVKVGSAMIKAISENNSTQDSESVSANGNGKAV